MMMLDRTGWVILTLAGLLCMPGLGFAVVLELQKLSNDEQRGLHEELAKAMMSVQ
jgi:hypothetical protein